MTLTVGRATNLTVTGIPQRAGNKIVLSGYVEEDTFAALNVREQQIRGLLDNPDESLVPVTWTVNPSIDGFYRPMSATFEPYAFESGRIGRFQIELSRIRGGFGHPAFESTVYAALRTNGHSITAPTDGIILGHPRSGSFSVAGNYSNVEANAPLNNLALTSETTLDGLVTVGAVATPLPRSTYRWWAAPSEFYAGSCQVEVEVAGVWRPLVGRQVGRFDHWRISNGIVRLTPSTGSNATGTPGRFEYYVSADNAWVGVDIAHSEYITDDTLFTTLAAIGFSTDPMVTVLRNSPEQVVVQVESSSTTLTYAVARGRRIITSTWTNITEFGDSTIGLAFATNVACTAATGAIRTTAAAADGAYIVLGVAAAAATDLTEGQVAPSVLASTSSMFIGAATNLSGGNGDVAQIIDTFYTVSSEHLEVVSY